MPTPDEMTIDERRKYVKLMAERYRKAKRKERSKLLSEMEKVSKRHRKHQIGLLIAEPHLWAGSRARGAAGVGEPGLHLCRAAHTQLGADRQALSQLWLARFDDRSGEPVGDDQPRDGAAHVAQEPRTQSAFAAHRS